MSPSSNLVFRSAIRWSLWIGLALLVTIGGIGAAVAGVDGALTALAGVSISVGFMAITAGSIVLANRASGSDLFVGAFFGIVMGGWLVKFVLFIVAMFALMATSWIVPGVLFAGLVAGIIGSLVVDALVLIRTKMPYVSDVSLPTTDSPTDD
ncbi:MAG TPA: hypothetical protein VK139_07765 [Microbacteriaceae bacterium]|nr:hypothetical protein [Microbacteriaceae bacterium]